MTTLNFFNLPNPSSLTMALDFFLFLFGMEWNRVTITEATIWPILLASDDDGWWWAWRNRWNAWSGKQKYSEKICPVPLCPPQNPHNLARPPLWVAGDWPPEKRYGLHPEVSRASTRNEYQKIFLGIMRGRHVRLTTYPPSLSRLSRQCGIFSISQPSSRPVTRLALLSLPVRLY
jgi:hypothetical protein